MKLGVVAGAACFCLWAATHAYPQPGGISPESQPDRVLEFAATVLADTEDAWHKLLGLRGQAYVEPTLVLYTGRASSACGMVTSDGGRVSYCPKDRRIYFDPNSVNAYAPKGDPLGDYLTIWLIVWGTSEHVQNLLWKVGPDADKRVTTRRSDCLVGVWSRNAELNGIFEDGDFPALSGALVRVAEKQAPALGTAAERVSSLEIGHSSGRPEDCRIQ